MKKYFLASVGLCSILYASSIPYTFSSGDSIKASEMNENFGYLLDKVNSLSTTGSIEPTFIGLSANSHNSSDGFIAKNNSCNSTYPGAKMCSSEEIMNSYSSNDTNGSGWIKAIYVPASITSSYKGSGSTNAIYTYSIAMDASGTTNQNQSSSSSTKLNNLIVTLPDGSISTSSDVLPVACCK